MKVRQLAALLRLLEKHNIAEFAQGDLKLRFHDPPMTGVVHEATGSDDDTPAGEMKLPPGVLDPRVVIQRINRKRAGLPDPQEPTS